MGWIYALFNAKITNAFRGIAIDNLIFPCSSMVEQEAVLAAPDRNIGMISG